MIFQERTYAVLLVTGSEKLDTQMRALLPETDFFPVKSAGSVGQARRMLLDSRFDLVLIQTPLKDDFGTQLAIDVCTDSSAAALLFVKSELLESVSTKVLEYGVMTLPMPTSSALVSQTLRAMCAQRERLRRIEARQQSLEEKMQEIRLVNRAKWLLIEKKGMTEDEAHRAIQKRAMEQRMPKADAAKEILRLLED